MSVKRPPDCMLRAPVYRPFDSDDSLLVFGNPDTYFERTDAAPGTKEKIEVLAFRAENGLPLFHPQDRQTLEGLVGALQPKINEMDHRKMADYFKGAI